MEKLDIIQMGRDVIHNRVPLLDGKFSDNKLNESAFREALIEVAGNDLTFTYKTFRDNPSLFTIIEAIIPDMVEEGLKGDEFFTRLVEYRNANNGDSFKFRVKKNVHYIVADASYGNGGIRRQRLQKDQSIEVETTLKVIQLYDDIERFLSSNITIAELTAAISKAFKERVLDDIYAAFKGITSNTVGLSPTYVFTGTYSEDKLLDMIAHVEAATGLKAYIVGTKKGLKNLKPSIDSDEAKSDLYNMGYYGKFYGTDCYSFNQVHKVGTEEFLFDDKTIYVFAADGDKPIKLCDIGSGEFYIDSRNANADRSTNVTYSQEFGIATIFASKMGIYTIN